MSNQTQINAESAPQTQEMTPSRLAPYVLRALVHCHLDDHKATLDDLVEELEVRRSDLRSTLSALDAEGHLDGSTMRLTLSGFAIGVALADQDLPPLRRSVTALEAA